MWKKLETLDPFGVLVLYFDFSGCTATYWSVSGVSCSQASLSLLRAWKQTLSLPEVWVLLLFVLGWMRSTELLPPILAR